MAYYQNVNIDICGSNLLIYLNIEKNNFMKLMMNSEKQSRSPFF